MVPLTVAVLTYNRAHYLKEALDAILSQTYENFELLVLDNCSIDNTPEVVLSIKDSRLRYVRNSPGGDVHFSGMSAKWIARGERLLITHDDDVMEPDMLEQQMALLSEYPELTAIWTNHSIIDEQGSKLQTRVFPVGADRIFKPGEYIARVAVEKLWFPPSCMIFSHRLLSQFSLGQHYRGVRKLSMGRSGRGVNRDQILPAEMNLRGPVAFINAPLIRYRQHLGQLTSNVSLVDGALDTYHTLRRFVRKTSYREEYEPLFDSQIVRFRAQEIIINVKSDDLAVSELKRLGKLLQSVTAECLGDSRSLELLLPVMLVCMQSGLAGVSEMCVNMKAPSVGSSRSVRALYCWAKYRVSAENILSSIQPASNIVILGSSFVSALLIREAREAGINVLCCLDSNVARQGRNFFGVPIVPHEWVSSYEGSIDLVLLSAERDHEEKLLESIRKYNKDLSVRSWKEFVDEVVLGV